MFTSLKTGARHGWVDFSDPYLACCDRWEFTTATKSPDCPRAGFRELGVASWERVLRHRKYPLVWDPVQETWLLPGP